MICLLSSRPSEAKTGTHTPQLIGSLRSMGPRLRGNDSLYDIACSAVPGKRGIDTP